MRNTFKSALIGAGLFLSACSPETTQYATIKKYIGESQGRKVDIIEQTVRNDQRDKSWSDYSLRCDVYSNNQEPSYIGTSNNFRYGSFDNIVVLNGDKNTSETSPSQSFKARKILEQAVIDVGNEQHKISEEYKDHPIRFM